MFDIATLDEPARKMVGADTGLATDDELFAAAVGLERARGLVELAEAQVLAELERRDATQRTYGHPTGRWLATAAGVSPRATAARVHTARTLTRFDRVRHAVADGDLTFDHATALASATNPRVHDALADCQHDLIALARHTTFTQWLTEVRRLGSLLDHDGPEPDDTTRNVLRFGETLDGVTPLTGTMTPDVALTIRTAIDARADVLFRRWTRDHHLDRRSPCRATLCMFALAELIGATSTGRAVVTLVLHNHDLTDRDGNPVPHTADGIWGCDPDLWAILVDHMGSPLDLGHGPRFATAAIRRALAHRDGGCGFPHCDQPPAHCDAHHLTSPLRHGTTSVDTMILLCRHHHTTLHQRGWTLTAHGGGTFTWTNPHGHQFTTPPRPHPRP